MTSRSEFFYNSEIQAMALELRLPVRIFCGIIFVFLCLGKSAEKSITRQRLLSELKEIISQKLTFDVPFNKTADECGVRLYPTNKKLLEWHFSFTGVDGTPFQDGIYHGRINLHPEYPRKAPSIAMLTPTGRWEVNKNICLSATSFHQETWDPNWNLRTLVMALRGHISSFPKEIGAVLSTPAVQRAYATTSRSWICPSCNIRHSNLCGARSGADTSLYERSDHNKYRIPKTSNRLLHSEGTIKQEGLETKSSVAFTNRVVTICLSLFIFAFQILVVFGGLRVPEMFANTPRW